MAKSDNTPKRVRRPVHVIAAQLMDCYDENGEIDAELFDGLQGELSDKLEAVGYLVAERNGWAEAARDESRRLVNRAAAFEMDGIRLTAKAHEILKVLGVRKLVTATTTAALHKQPLRTVITDEDAIPVAYRRSEVVETIDKKALAVAIDAGAEVTGATRKRGDDRLKWK